MKNAISYREWDYTRRADRPGDPVADAMDMLREWHERREDVAPDALLREALERTKAREAFLLKPAGAQRLANRENSR